MKLPKFNYKLVLFDLDGTLLNDHRGISETNLEALKALKSMGVKVGFATGRTLKSVSPYLKTVNPNGPLILFNGCRIWDTENNHYVSQINLKREATIAALRLAREYPDLHINLYVNDEIYISKKTPTSLESETKDGVPHNVVGDLCTWMESNSTFEATKIMLIGQPQRLELFSKDFEFSCDIRCSLIRSEWNYLEIMHEGINKGAALPLVEKVFHIGGHEIISFGDNLNDIDLIKKSGIGIAMENAHPTLKSIADNTIGDNNSNAIGQFLNNLFQLNL